MNMERGVAGKRQGGSDKLRRRGRERVRVTGREVKSERKNHLPQRDSERCLTSEISMQPRMYMAPAKVVPR